MASAELSVVYSEDDHDHANSRAPQPGNALHRIQEVRRLQGMSLRTAARQLGTDIRSIRAQEQATSDLRLSDLYNWQRALEVPVSELLVEEDGPLSRPVRERGAMLKIMKTARSLVESAPPGPARRMAENLVEQLLELMPELKDVSPWHSVGQRRSLDELGRIAEQPIGDLGSYYDAAD
jgi:transcriptional regulator with XRE-family HTH domain